MASDPSDELSFEDPSPAGVLAGTIGAAAFKARCLQIMDRVSETGAEVTITKHGRPVAKLVPAGTRTGQPSLLGSCKETLVIFDDNDLIPSTADEWVDWEAELDRGLDGPGVA